MKEISFRDHVLPLKDKLFRLALRITLDRAEAEDIVQDTLMKLWGERERLSEVENLEAWGLTICRNRAMDRIKRAGANASSLDEERDSPVEQTNPQVVLERKESLERVMKLMDGLSEVQRSVMELRDIEGYSYQEISNILNINESQVKVYLHRARQKIKKEYENGN